MTLSPGKEFVVSMCCMAAVVVSASVILGAAGAPIWSGPVFGGVTGCIWGNLASGRERRRRVTDYLEALKARAR